VTSPVVLTFCWQGCPEVSSFESIGVAVAGVFRSVSGVKLQFETGGLILSAGSDEAAGVWANTGQPSKATTAKAVPTPLASRPLRTASSSNFYRNIFSTRERLSLRNHVS
jgi:hypothetical protein